MIISFDALRACDRQTDTPPVAMSCSNIAERDNKPLHTGTRFIYNNIITQ